MMLTQSSLQPLLPLLSKTMLSASARLLLPPRRLLRSLPDEAPAGENSTAPGIEGVERQVSG